MLLIMVKPNVTLRLVSLNIWESARTGKNIKSTKNSAVRDGTNDFKIKLQENLLIHCDVPQLNKTSESAPLRCYSLKTYHICSFASLYCSSEPFR